VYAAFVQAVYPEGEYKRSYTWSKDNITRNRPTVGASRTSDAYDDLIDGNVDIIFCAKPSEHHIQQALERGLTFNMTPIGKEAFCFLLMKKTACQT